MIRQEKVKPPPPEQPHGGGGAPLDPWGPVFWHEQDYAYGDYDAAEPHQPHDGPVP